MTVEKKSLLIEATFDLQRFRVHKRRGWPPGTPEVFVQDLPSLEEAMIWCADHHPGCDVVVSRMIDRDLKRRPLLDEA